MTAPPVVGIPMRPQSTADAPIAPPRLVVNRAYLESVERAGGLVLGLPLAGGRADHVAALLDRCDALCLCGGPDVDPRRYGEEPRGDCHVGWIEELDECELALARAAVDRDLPVLGVCRGMQVLNVACGGSLWQDVHVQGAGDAGHARDDRRERTVLAHAVRAAPGSRLAALIGTAPIEINSLHHQAVREPAPGFEVTAVAPDGIIEGMERPDRRFVVAVQCHPEELSASRRWAQRLFDGLVLAASSPAG